MLQILLKLWWFSGHNFYSFQPILLKFSNLPLFPKRHNRLNFGQDWRPPNFNFWVPYVVKMLKKFHEIFRHKSWFLLKPFLLVKKFENFQNSKIFLKKPQISHGGELNFGVLWLPWQCRIQNYIASSSTISLNFFDFPTRCGSLSGGEAFIFCPTSLGGNLLSPNSRVVSGPTTPSCHWSDHEVVTGSTSFSDYVFCPILLYYHWFSPIFSDKISGRFY